MRTRLVRKQADTKESWGTYLVFWRIVWGACESILLELKRVLVFFREVVREEVIPVGLHRPQYRTVQPRVLCLPVHHRIVNLRSAHSRKHEGSTYIDGPVARAF